MCVFVMFCAFLLACVAEYDSTELENTPVTSHNKDVVNHLPFLSVLLLPNVFCLCPIQIISYTLQLPAAIACGKPPCHPDSSKSEKELQK